MTEQDAEFLEMLREWWSDYPENDDFVEPFLLRLIKELQEELQAERYNG